MFKRTVTHNFNPSRDWLLILMCTSIFLIGTVLYSVYVFRSVTDGTLITVSSEDVNVKTLPKESLVKTINFIEAKQNRRTGFLNGEFDIPDPSL